MKYHCIYHCWGCDACFSSLKAFDLHRSGSFQEGTRHCLDPDAVKGDTPDTSLVVKTEKGLCELRRGEPCQSATIYQTEAGALKGFGGRLDRMRQPTEAAA